MKNKVFFIVLMAVTLALTSCIILDPDLLWNNFNSSLRGKWETTSGSKVTLEIEYSSIIISGSIQSNQPLYNYTRDISLDGYSTETDDEQSNYKAGSIYIRDKGSYQYPISYTYTASGPLNLVKTLTLQGTSNMVFTKK